MFSNKFNKAVILNITSLIGCSVTHWYISLHDVIFTFLLLIVNTNSINLYKHLWVLIITFITYELLGTSGDSTQLSQSCLLLFCKWSTKKNCRNDYRCKEQYLSKFARCHTFHHGECRCRAKTKMKFDSTMFNLQETNLNITERNLKWRNICAKVSGDRKTNRTVGEVKRSWQDPRHKTNEKLSWQQVAGRTGQSAALYHGL